MVSFLFPSLLLCVPFDSLAGLFFSFYAPPHVPFGSVSITSNLELPRYRITLQSTRFQEVLEILRESHYESCAVPKPLVETYDADETEIQSVCAERSIPWTCSMLIAPFKNVAYAEAV